MEKSAYMVLDFVFPVEHEEPKDNAPAAGVRLSKCSCGANHYALASEMPADSANGLPASRMYECMACGTYRLG
jgi:hypothetical protein